MNSVKHLSASFGFVFVIFFLVSDVFSFRVAYLPPKQTGEVLTSSRFAGLPCEIVKGVKEAFGKFNTELMYSGAGLTFSTVNLNFEYRGISYPVGLCDSTANRDALIAFYDDVLTSKRGRRDFMKNYPAGTVNFLTATELEFDPETPNAGYVAVHVYKLRKVRDLVKVTSRHTYAYAGTANIIEPESRGIERKPERPMILSDLETIRQAVKFSTLKLLEEYANELSGN